MKKWIALFLAALLVLSLSAVSFAGEKTVEIGIVSISVADDNNARCIEGVKAYADEKGWTLTVVDANGSADEANSAIVNFVTKGADYVLDLVFPASSLGTGLAAAQAAGVPVSTWGGGMGEGMYMANGSGAPFSVPVVNKLLEDAQGAGEILALTYHTGEVARQREEKLDEAAAQFPGITITKNEVRIPGAVDDGAQYANAWLASHPAGEGNLAIWGSWDDPAMGAISSLKQQGRSDVKVYGQNGNPEAIIAVKDGWMTATIWEDSYMEGYLLAKEFETIKEQGDAYVPGYKEYEGYLITAETVDAFMREHPEALN
jgi:ribose transport system substrate-binding protein